MPDRRALPTQAEVTRYLKAHRDAGIPVTRVEISREGRVVIYTTEAAAEAEPNPWDRP